MANPNPYKARQARKRRKKANVGTLKDVQGVLWEAIQMLELHILEPAERGEKIDVRDLCRLTHALSQAATTYAKITEVGEFEERLAALEAAQGTGRAA